MPLYRRRTSAERLKARRYERRYKRRTDMRPNHRLTTGPISQATKRARRRLSMKGLYKAINKLRETVTFPPFATGLIEADPRVIDIILEAAAASNDPAEFAQLYLEAPPEYLGTAPGVAALALEALVVEDSSLAEKFVETVIESGKDTFTAIFVGKLSEQDWEHLDNIDFLSMRALIENGDHSYENGTTSDITIFECATDPAAFADDADFEAFDPSELREEGGLAQEVFEFITGAGQSEQDGAIVEHGKQSWLRSDGRWLVQEAKTAPGPIGAHLKKLHALAKEHGGTANTAPIKHEVGVAHTDVGGFKSHEHAAKFADAAKKHFPKSNVTHHKGATSVGVSSHKLTESEIDESGMIAAGQVHVASGADSHTVTYRTGDSLASPRKHWTGSKFSDDAKDAKVYKDKGEANTAARAARKHKATNESDEGLAIMAELDEEFSPPHHAGMLIKQHGHERAASIAHNQAKRADLPKPAAERWHRIHRIIQRKKLTPPGHHPYESEDLDEGDKTYVFHFHPQKGSAAKRIRWERRGKSMEGVHAAAKAAATKDYPEAHGFLTSDPEQTGEKVNEEKWSAGVQAKWSPPEGLFTKSGATIAKVLKSQSDSNKQAMERLNFYINRAGDKLPADQKAELSKAKELLSEDVAIDEEMTGDPRLKGLEAALTHARARYLAAMDGPSKESARKGLETARSRLKQARETLESVAVADESQLDEKAPPGWEGTVLAMKKKHPDKFGKGGGKINPWALAHSMAKKGYRPHFKKGKSGNPVKVREAFDMSEADAKLAAEYVDTDHTLAESTRDASHAGKWYLEADTTSAIVAFPDVTYTLEGDHAAALSRLMSEAEASTPEVDEVDELFTTKLREYAEANGTPVVQETTVSSSVGGFSAATLGKVGKLRKLLRKKDAGGPDDPLKQAAAAS